MCIICLEFNRSKDLKDASRMIEAARREADSISEEHLTKIEEKLKQIRDTGDHSKTLDPED